MLKQIQPLLGIRSNKLWLNCSAYLTTKKALIIDNKYDYRVKMPQKS